MDFRPGSIDIAPDELVQFLLEEAGQVGRDAVNPAEILEYLKLEHFPENLYRIVPPEARIEGQEPRALLSFRDRLVVTQSGMKPARVRFSVLHEIGHYVLPTHLHSIYLCDEQGLSQWAKLAFEKEANDFAASLLFQGERFSVEANSSSVTAATVEMLAHRYRASYEATARRLVEKNRHSFMFIAFEKEEGPESVDIDMPARWKVRYCVASPSFGARYVCRVRGTLCGEVYDGLTQPGRPISRSLVEDLTLDLHRGRPLKCRGEFFSNSYNIFCLLQPFG